MAEKSSTKKPGKATSNGAANKSKKPKKNNRRAIKKPAAAMMTTKTITTEKFTTIQKTTTRKTITIQSIAVPKAPSKKKRIAAKPKKASSKKAQAKEVRITIPLVSPLIIISSYSLLLLKPSRLPPKGEGEGEGGARLEAKACDDTSGLTDNLFCPPSVLCPASLDFIRGLQLHSIALCLIRSLGVERGWSRFFEAARG